MTTTMNTAIVIGAQGGIGQATIQRLLADDTLDLVIGVSRHDAQANQNAHEKLRWFTCNSTETEIQQTSEKISSLNIQLRYLVISTGILHDTSEGIKPEKRLSDLNEFTLEKVFAVNTFLPLLWLKHISRLLRRDVKTDIVVLSARVGSINDNHLGGWHSYRASKSALNMLLKNVAIEFKLRFPKTKLTSFHPGSTDTDLSKPFQANIPADSLFPPSYVADQLFQLISSTPRDGRLSFKDWANKDIDW